MRKTILAMICVLTRRGLRQFSAQSGAAGGVRFDAARAAC